MTELSAAFAPDWVSPPGESILDLIEERGWTQTELARRLGYTEKHVSQLVNGKVPLSDDAALRLERVLGSSAAFWLARETQYREHLSRLVAARAHAGWVGWLDKLPLRELMKCGAIAKRRIDVKHKPDLVNDCLRFFGVASPDDWHNHYGDMQLTFRRSRVEQSDIGAISAWLRLGEQQAETLDGPNYHRARCVAALKTIARGVRAANASVAARGGGTPGVGARYPLRSCQRGGALVEPDAAPDPVVALWQEQRQILVHFLPRGRAHPAACQYPTGQEVGFSG